MKRVKYAKEPKQLGEKWAVRDNFKNTVVEFFSTKRQALSYIEKEQELFAGGKHILIHELFRIKCNFIEAWKR